MECRAVSEEPLDHTLSENNYVVEVQHFANRIAFGTTLNRNIWQVDNKFPNIGPQTYCNPNDNFIDILSRKIRSNRGIGYFASTSVYNPIKVRTPSPTRYQPNIKFEEKKKISIPFNYKQYKPPISTTPGPGTYNLNKKKCNKLNYSCVKGKVNMKPCVDMHCNKHITHTCHKCKSVCKGDYFHKNFEVFLCQLCWIQQRIQRDTYNYDELKKFIKIRDCTRFHKHNMPSIYGNIEPRREIIKQLSLENYLNMYITDFDTKIY